MAQQNLNLGTTPNDGTGDTLRCAFCKTETNFTDVYSCISGIDTSISNINSCLTELDNQIDIPELWSMGYNYSGQLGTNNTISYSAPTQEHCGGTNWCMVSSNSHTSAIKTDGTLWGWGTNCRGRLGTNNTIPYSVPTQEHCGGTNWCMVSAGVLHTSAIKTNGTLWGWGCNGSGRLGTNNNIDYSTPTQEHCGGTNWCMVSGGGSHTSAIKTNGTLWSWGYNGNGQLGLNNTLQYATARQEHCGGTNWCMVSAGNFHTTAIKTDGTLWGWGSGSYGKLGLNNSTNYSTPQQEVCGGTNWCMVNGGISYTAAIKTDGTIWSWGSNAYGQLGLNLNSASNKSTPQQEACNGTNWCTFSVKNLHTSAIKTDGTLWSWGDNAYGALGTNNTTIYSAPTQEACGGTTWCMVSAGSFHINAIRIV
jgi:alpha-tubulin suppressor-like RCC1 family protein